MAKILLLFMLLLSEAAAAVPRPVGRLQQQQHSQQEREAGLSISSTRPQEAKVPKKQHPRAERGLQEQDSKRLFASQRLKESLLANYDKTTFPFETMWNTTSSSSTSFIRQGLMVETGFNFHRVFDVDVTNSVADLIVWVRQKWRDPRLAWENTTSAESSDDEIQTLHFWVGDGSGADGETSEIWTPDLQLWNLESSLETSLADAYAVVSSDGTVFWSRPGHVKPVCKFQGLDDFPFDTLDCTIEIGSWSFSGLYIRPVKMDGTGYTVGGSETAGESFAEFSLQSVSCEEYVYPPYPVAPEEDWPVLLYTVTFQRAWQPYARGYLAMQVILNLVAFCCFWLPPHIGERMSLAITTLLAAVASELVVASNLPAASELTWFSKFSLTSTLFTALVLFESAAVVYFYYHTGDDLVPRWCRWMQDKIRNGNCNTNHLENGQEQQVRFSKTEAPKSSRSVDDDALPDESSNTDVLPTTICSGANGPNRTGDFDATSTAHENSLREDGDGRDDNDAMGSSSSISDMLDQSLSLGPQQSQQQRRRSSAQRSMFEKSHLASFRTRKTIKTILGRDADDFKNVKEMENNRKWQQMATNIDDVARVVFPAAYCIFIAITFSRLNP